MYREIYVCDLCGEECEEGNRLKARYKLSFSPLDSSDMTKEEREIMPNGNELDICATCMESIIHEVHERKRKIKALKMKYNGLNPLETQRVR